MLRKSQSCVREYVKEKSKFTLKVKPYSEVEEERCSLGYIIDVFCENEVYE
jgi:hypothetical protein